MYHFLCVQDWEVTGSDLVQNVVFISVSLDAWLAGYRNGSSSKYIDTSTR